MCLVTFKDVDISENWQRAKQACKNENMKLARIDNIDLFNSAKTRVYKGAPSQENFWTGLKYEDEKLVWSGGREAFCNGTLSEVLDCAGLKKWDDPSCFLITSVDDTLQPSKCDIAHRFICQSGKILRFYIGWDVSPSQYLSNILVDFPHGLPSPLADPG